MAERTFNPFIGLKNPNEKFGGTVTFFWVIEREH